MVVQLNPEKVKNPMFAACMMVVQSQKVLEHRDTYAHWVKMENQVDGHITEQVLMRWSLLDKPLGMLNKTCGYITQQRLSDIKTSDSRKRCTKLEG